MSISQNYSTTRPSLNLNFAKSKTLDSRITFTRDSVATFVNEDGLIKTVASGVPRFEHNPLTGECLGLLMEQQSTNICLYSEQFDNAIWIKGASTITANSATSPTGETTADLFVEDTSSNGHTLAQSLTISAGAIINWSCFVKRASGTRHVRLQVESDAAANGFRAYVDLTNETIALDEAFGTGTTNSSSTIIALSNGWYRISVTGTVAPTATSIAVRFYMQNTTTGTVLYTGDGTSGLYLWGAQVETGNRVLTSYIPTTTAIVTRSQDAAIIYNTSTNILNPSEFTIFTNTSMSSINLTDSATHKMYNGVSDGDVTSNWYTIRYVSKLTSAGSPYIDGFGRDSTGTQFDFAGSDTFSLPNPVKCALAVKLNDSAFSYNGNISNTDTSCTVSTAMDRFVIGGTPTSGTIAQVIYYPIRLTNSQLQALTV